MSKTSKEKEISVLEIVCACVCLLPLFYGMYFYQDLPLEIPTSFGFDGKIRGTTQKEIFVFAFPLIMALGTLFLHFMVNTDPKNRHQDKKDDDGFKMDYTSFYQYLLSALHLYGAWKFSEYGDRRRSGFRNFVDFLWKLSAENKSQFYHRNQVALDIAK